MPALYEVIDTGLVSVYGFTCWCAEFIVVLIH